MRKDHDIDSGVVEAERIQISAKDYRVGAAIDDNATRSVPYIGRVSLTDVQHANDQLTTAGISDEARNWWKGWFAWRAPAVWCFASLPATGLALLLLRLNEESQ